MSVGLSSAPVVTFVFGVAAWILAMVATSIIGCAFTSAPLILAISLVMLELFRFCLIYMYRVVQPVFARTSVNAVKFPVDDLSSSLAGLPVGCRMNVWRL